MAGVKRCIKKMDASRLQEIGPESVLLIIMLRAPAVATFFLWFRGIFYAAKVHPLIAGVRTFLCLHL